MFGQGARHYVFFGRSGAKKPAAQNIVGDLRERGADVQVICGDVSIFDEVHRAILRTASPIGGVIQAAMSLNVCQLPFMTKTIY